MNWQPKPGERVIAVLPDGHEIEGTYSHIDRSSDPAFHCVTLHTKEDLFVRTVKPVPVEEPKTFGACVKDRATRKWLRIGPDAWAAYPPGLGILSWSTLVRSYGPLTIVNADPWGES